MDTTTRVAELKASRGFAWWGEAFRLFRRAPVQWMSLTAGWIAITLGLLIVPFIGPVIASVLQPVFFASFAITAYKQLAGERLAMGDLFAGFRRNMRPLVNLGAMLVLAQVAVIMLMTVLGLPMASKADAAAIPTIADYAELLSGKEWIIILGILLTGVVNGLAWFAPPLIAFHGMSTLQAIRWSAYASISNLGTMAVYGATLLTFFILAVIPWGMGLIVVMPVMVLTTYVGYREVFEG